MAVSLSPLQLLVGLLLCFSCSVAAQTSLSVSVDNKAINALTTYTYSIFFGSTIPRTNITLYFPAEVSLSAVTIITLNSTITLNSSNSSAFIVSPGNNTIWINRTVTYSLVVAVLNVKNPSSVQQTIVFSIRSNISLDSVAISPAFFIEYVAGTLQSCNYIFTGTTEQTNCTLNVSVTLANPLAIGSNSILIGFANPWENSKSKYLTYNTTVTCGFIAGNQSGTGNCTTYTSQLQIDFTSNFILPANSILIALIYGVNCPPTVATTTSSSYVVVTRDSLGREVDRRSSCTIANTAVTTASGYFNNTADVNANYSGIVLIFPPTSITF